MVSAEEMKFEDAGVIDEQKVESRKSKNYIHNFQYLAVTSLVFFAFVTNLASIVTNYWVCDDDNDVNYGLWNACNDVNDTTTNLTLTKCAIQTLHGIQTMYAETQLVDELNLAKALLIISLCFYFIAFSMLIFTYIYAKLKLHVKKSLIYLIRNLLVICLFLLIIAILVQIIGFYLVVYAEKLSTSSFMLFIYFILAVFVTNTVNFFTIKYKSIFYDVLYTPGTAAAAAACIGNKE